MKRIIIIWGGVTVLLMAALTWGSFYMLDYALAPNAERQDTASRLATLYETKPGQKQLWVTRGVQHALSYKAYPEEYARRLRAFTTQ